MKIVEKDSQLAIVFDNSGKKLSIFFSYFLQVWESWGQRWTFEIGLYFSKQFTSFNIILVFLLFLFNQGQLFLLMQHLENTTPHFIRCIKPNDFQSPGNYNQGLVLQQLRCCGVLEIVRISRAGFPTRMSHQKFTRR